MRFEPRNRVPVRIRLWSLDEDVLVEVGPGAADHLVVITRWGELRIDHCDQVVLQALQRMSFGPVSVENLPVQLDGFRQVLDRLGNSVVQSLGLDDEAGPLLSVLPVSRQARFRPPVPLDPDQPVRLSRFVGMHPSGGELVLDSPISDYRVVLHRHAATCLAVAVCAPTTVGQLAEAWQMPATVVADILSYLVASGMVVTAERGTAAFAEDTDPALLCWAPHDLMYHASSRMGRHDLRHDPAHGGDRAAAAPPPAPLTRQLPAGTRFPLHRPPLAGGLHRDPPLPDAVGVTAPPTPRTGREPTAEQLGELLYRAARIRWAQLVTAPAGAGHLISERPYPSTGDLYELELYLTVDRCAGLPRGNYHYDPREHALTLIGDAEPQLAELLDAAKVAAGSTERPAVLITVTTRIGRLSWRFGPISYATTLRHVGALQQTLHLVARAMGLASSAVAVSDGCAADDALRLDCPSEVSVGEFIIGSGR